MKYLFSSWAKISPQIQKSPLTFLFFDYDGTLTPIVATPELAKISPAVRNSLKKLKKDPRFKLAIISGRSLANVKKMVGIKGIVYAGNHGLEIEDRANLFHRVGGINSTYAVEQVTSKLNKALADIKGVIVEDKGCTLSVHYRLVKPAKRILVKRAFSRIVAPYVLSRKLKSSAGKMVLEVRPGIEWDKGKAVLCLLKKYKRALPIHIGDDVTDEDAFKAIKGKGISIFVGPRKIKSKADYFLKNTSEVKLFIERMLDL